ncbi:MAG: hypothetical protein ABL921_13655 [Pirellula sp.]
MTSEDDLTHDEIKTIAILDIQLPAPVGGYEQWQGVADRLASRIPHAVEIISSDLRHFSSPSYDDLFESVAVRGYRRIVLIPIGTLPIDFSAIGSAVALAKALWPDLSIFVASELLIKDWACLISESIDVHLPCSSQQMLIVGSTQREISNSQYDLPLVCHELRQRHHDTEFEYAYLCSHLPNLSDSLERLVHLRDIPLLFLAWKMADDEYDQFQDCVRRILGTELPSAEACSGPLILTSQGRRQMEPCNMLHHPSLIHLLMDRYLHALSWRSIERYFEMKREEHSGPEGIAKFHTDLMSLDKRLDTMLPAEYRGRTDNVRPTSMGTASLKLDEKGEVAWDEIWTSFCDLAMAGGPPHRGKLLEAVSGAEARRDIDAYHSVAREIRRGIEMVTGLKTIESEALGWVGIQCDDEAMAVWLLRAIIVENVMVRREGTLLFVPAGPSFTVKREIKNVITSVAKSVHYWRAHLRLRFPDN